MRNMGTMSQMAANNGNAYSYQSSNMMTYRMGSDGQPQVYQASSSQRTAPGGVRETRKSELDSTSGMQRMAIGHHLGERGHVVERARNRRTGEEEELQDYVNLEESQADQFQQEWNQRTRAFGRGNAIGGRLTPYDESRSHRNARHGATNSPLAIEGTSVPDNSRTRRREREQTGKVKSHQK